MGITKSMSKIKEWIQFLTGFRKLTMGVLFMGVTLLLLFLGKVSGSEWISTNRDVVVAFLATNIAAKIVGATQQWLKKKK